MSQDRPGPRYRGTYKNIDLEGGYAIWIPSDWRKIKMTNGHKGTIYTPLAEGYDTCISTEKVVLDYSITDDDIPILREGFNAGLASLPGIEIESQDEAITPTLKLFEARFTFLEGDIRRQRWLRVVYWGDGQLIMMAQGETPEEFEYWLPMFYNALMTVELPTEGSSGDGGKCQA